MSDQEEQYVIDNEDEDAEQVDEEAGEAELEEAETETSESIYRSGKDQQGFDDDAALQAFTDVFNDENAEPKLRGKAIKRACQIICSRGQTDEIDNYVTQIFVSYQSEFFTTQKLVDIIANLQSAAAQSDEALKVFLEVCTNCIRDIANREALTNVYVDLKLRQAEYYMKYADYANARSYLTEAEHLCPIPPDSDNPLMCRAALRILILRIELAEIDHDEPKAFESFDLAGNLQKDFLDSNSRAALEKVNGAKLMRKHKFKDAKNAFYEAFKLYNSVGSDGRLHCLPYCALAAMLSDDKISIFMADEARPFVNHPVVAPLAQLQEAFQRCDIVMFKQRIPSAKKIFNDDPEYAEFIGQLELKILKQSILNFCPTYDTIEVEYIAKRLDAPADQVYSLVERLILEGRLNGKLVAESNTLTMNIEVPLSPQLRGLDTLLTRCEQAVKLLRVSNKIM